MADDLFDKKKIIAVLKAQGISDKEIEKLYGPMPKPVVNSKKAEAHRAKNAWKYDNKHKRPILDEDDDPDYEPIEELRKKTQRKKPYKPRISKKKPKPKPPKNDWNAASEARLKALYEAGYSSQEMADEFKTTKDAITGKLNRLRNAGWKGAIGTTHAPLPKPAITEKEAAKLSPGMKRFLAMALERNFGAAGRFFAKKWGLADNRSKPGGGSGADTTAAVIKSNEAVMSALTKLDTALRRSTSTLTKSIANSTQKMVDAINTTVDLVKRNEGIQSGNPTGIPTSKPGGGIGGAGVGMIAAMLGGVGLSSMFSSRADASLTTGDMSPDLSGMSHAERSEATLRELGISDASVPDPSDIEVKVKELTFDADDILFEADQFKFMDKKGNAVSGAPSGAGSGSGASSGGGGAGGGPDATPATPPKPNGGFFNGLLDSLGSSGGGSSGGGKGMFNSLMDKLGIGTGKNGGPSSGAEGKKSEGGPTSSPTSSGENSGTLAEQRKKFSEEMAKDPELREKVRAMASAEEGGDSEARKAVIETMMNRATAHGKSLADTVGNRAYYEPYQNGAFDRHLNKVRSNSNLSGAIDKEIDEVLAGSNRSNYATHNGSAGVRLNAMKTQTTGWDSPNGEIFTRKDRPEFSHIHGAGTTRKESDWYKGTLEAEALRKNEAATGGPGGSTSGLKRIPIDGGEMMSPDVTRGKMLLEEQKMRDSEAATPPASPDSSRDSSAGDKHSDLGNNREMEVLATVGPNHFADYPMSDQGVGA
jgi:hypothetical protein